MTGLSGKTRRLLLLFLLFSSLGLAVLILTDGLPFLRGPAPETSEWYWPYLLRPLGRWWPTILAALVLAALSAWWLSAEKSSRRRDYIFLSALFAGSLLLQLALIYADRASVSMELVDRTLSNLASGFFAPAAETEDIDALLRAYPEQMVGFTSDHARTHPPGLIAANWLTVQIFARWPAPAEALAQLVRPLRCTDLWLLNRPPQVAAALAFWSILPLFAAALAVIPAYGLARQLLQGRAARLAVAVTATLPALTLFAPKSVQLYAFLVLTLGWILQSAISKGSNARFFLAGFVLSLMTYLSLGNAALYAPLVLLAVLQERPILNYSANKASRWRSVLEQMAVFSLGAGSLWLASWLMWGVPPWEIARTGLQQHYLLATSQRRYEWWVIWNLLDLLLFAGWPMMLGFAGSIVLAIKFWGKERYRPTTVLALSLLALIFFLDLSGSARGEVGRIWLFYIPLIAFPSARFWSMALPSHRNLWLVVALQLLITVAIGLSWRPVRAVIVVAEEPAMPSGSPEYDLQANFSEQPFSLTGYTLEEKQISAGEQLSLTLFWRAQKPAQRPYTVFNHVVDEDNHIVAQQDNWPVGGTWPPTCWRGGDLIVDTYHISLPDDLPAGNYRLLTGMYDSLTGQRVPLQNGQDAVPLGEIVIQEP